MKIHERYTFIRNASRLHRQHSALDSSTNFKYSCEASFFYEPFAVIINQTYYLLSAQIIDLFTFLHCKSYSV